MSNNCLCDSDQSSLCGFDHINHERTHDCKLVKPVHTTKKKQKYCKVITKEFPLNYTKAILASPDDRLTLVVQYQYNTNENSILSIKLKSYDVTTNTTQWHNLSLEDVKTIARVFTSLKNEIEQDNNEDEFLF